MRTSCFFYIILPLFIVLNVANAGQPNHERVIICMVPIEHADAEQLADTLIIKDNPSVVRMLIKVIKGREDFSECQNFQSNPEADH